MRFAVLSVAFVAWGALAWTLVYLDVYSSTSVSSGTGRPTTEIQSQSTLYQEQPGMARGILVAAAITLLIATASVVWRVARRSERLGVTCLIVAGLVGASAILGMMTIGMFLVPLAALLVVLALPIAPEPRTMGAPPSSAPPGWYGDPFAPSALRYWNGRAWTEHTAAVMPAIGASRVCPTAEPAKGASPKANTPPAAATSQ